MPNISKKQLDAIQQTIRKLAELIEAIAVEKIEVDPQIAEQVRLKVEQRICLACGQKIDENDRSRRGQDSACYATTRGRIRRGETSESEQIQLGRMTAEAKLPGRPAKQDIARDVATSQANAVKILEERRKNKK